MKLFGHTSTQHNLHLDEVVVEISAAEARELGAFLVETAARMDEMGAEYDHEHLSDHKSRFESCPQFVVVAAR